MAPPAKDEPRSAFGFTKATRNVCPASCEAATRNFSSRLYPTYTSAPRTVNTGLSVSSRPRSAHENDQLRPKSRERTTTISRLLFCSHEAYTVCRSTGSTMICGSNCPVGNGSSGLDVCHDPPLSSLMSRFIEGAVQVAHPGTVPYCG